MASRPIHPPDFVHGGNGLGDVVLPAAIGRQPDPRPAHRLIIDLIRANPGEVEIVAVGRMTNLALALREDPGIAALVKQVVIMGGAFGINGVLGNVTPAAEANIWGDPLAADEVTAAAWPLTIVSLDVTQQTRMPTDYLRALADDGGATGQFIWDISRFYEDFHRQGGVDSIFVHDSSAVAYLLRPSLFETRLGAIRVVSRRPRLRHDHPEARDRGVSARRLGRPAGPPRLHQRRSRRPAAALSRHHHWPGGLIRTDTVRRY